MVAAIDEANAYIRREPRKAAELFLSSEPSSLSVEQIEDMLRQVDGEWSVKPAGVMVLADFMVRSGALKNGAG
ncbi:hypothetical protein [Pseudomonas asplenii]|uniref:hypothetical protein n=1 Tax=Pseudomonas asplenii TaxID=53407 RepID=UPI00037C037B|nr:hypothetical protein [Pseudomonas fuscovaginae]